VAVGFLADQHAGRSGTMLPFFGRLCSTSTAPAVFALRYRLPLRVGICYRVGLAQWTIEVSDEIPTAEQGRRRSVEAIMLDVNRAFEAAIRRDPANWFWVHNRWKAASPKRLTRPTDLAQAEAGVSEVPEAPRAEPVARGRLPQGD
jgi:KDO2-lipid IV(A) lauroyltransferase